MIHEQKAERKDMKKYFIIPVLMLSFVLPLSACTNMSKTQQGTLSGGVVGAGLGAGISAIAGGDAGVGAIVGGALGAVAGGIHGHNQETKK